MGFEAAMSDDEEEAWEANRAAVSGSASDVSREGVASESTGKTTRSTAAKVPAKITPEDFATKLLEEAAKMVDAYKRVPAFSTEEYKTILEKLDEMSRCIKRAVPQDLRKKMCFFQDAKQRATLVDSMLLIPGIRDGYKQLMDIIVLIIDCAAYLDVELFGFRANGTTKGVQQLLRKYIVHCLV